MLVTVDDDPSVSRAVARDLRRRYGSEYRILRATAGEEALDAIKEVILRGDQVAAILADYRMPRMNGIEFLEAAMDLVPQARRALLTAYADTNAAISAINVVDVDHYLLKPWEPPEEKLYPVVDDLLDLLAARRPRTGPQDQDPRSSLVGRVVRGPGLPGPQSGAVPLVPGRRARRPEVADRGERRPVPGPGGDHRRRARRWCSRRSRSRDGGRAEHDPGDRLLRRDHHRWGAGRVGRRRLRRLRGPADGRHRAQRGRRPGRAELADRELPGLSRRGLGRPAHRSGPPAGRCGSAPRSSPRVRRPGSQRQGPGARGAAGRRLGHRGAHGRARHAG